MGEDENKRWKKKENRCPLATLKKAYENLLCKVGWGVGTSGAAFSRGGGKGADVCQAQCRRGADGEPSSARRRHSYA